MAAGLRAGDPEALRELHAMLGPLVFGFLCRSLPDRATAEDVCQQVFTEVWRRGAQYDPDRAGLSTWVLTIARSRAIDELRRRTPEPQDPATMPQHVSPAEVDLLADRWRVAALLALLPDEDAALLRMRFYEELTQAEISARTGVPMGTVKTRMVRGLERLRELLDAEDARTADAIAASQARLAGVPA